MQIDQGCVGEMTLMYVKWPASSISYHTHARIFVLIFQGIRA